jgi:hypothetical protein
MEKLSNLQLEILKLYQFKLDDNQLIDIKKILANYFADKANIEFDKLWEENNWTNKTIDEWLNEDNK